MRNFRGLRRGASVDDAHRDAVWVARDSDGQRTDVPIVSVPVDIRQNFSHRHFHRLNWVGAEPALIMASRTQHRIWLTRRDYSAWKPRNRSRTAPTFANDRGPDCAEVLHRAFAPPVLVANP